MNAYSYVVCFLDGRGGERRGEVEAELNRVSRLFFVFMCGRKIFLFPFVLSRLNLSNCFCTQCKSERKPSYC
jgi:hypothetical protein